MPDSHVQQMIAFLDQNARSWDRNYGKLRAGCPADMRRRIWSWLKRADNRDVVKMSAAALAALIAGTWALFTFVVDHEAAKGISAGSGAVAAGRDASGNTIIYSSPPTPSVKP